VKPSRSDGTIWGAGLDECFRLLAERRQRTVGHDPDHQEQHESDDPVVDERLQVLVVAPANWALLSTPTSAKSTTSRIPVKCRLMELKRKLPMPSSGLRSHSPTAVPQ